jgi:hypothetical protein
VPATKNVQNMMRVSLVIVALLLSFSLKASVIVANKVYPGSIMLPLYNSGKMISLDDFMKLKPSGYKKLTGKRMNLKEIICLKIVQHHLKNTINNDGTVNLQKLADDETDSMWNNLDWVALGFFLGPIGLLIAVIINDSKRHQRIQWTAVGVGFLCLAFLLYLFAF